MHGLAGHQTDQFPLGQRFDDRDDRRDANRAVEVSAIGLAITGLFELSLGLLSGSVGLLGDALHNLSDVSTSGVVFIGFRLSKRDCTDSHPYGWERAEDIAGLGVALVIWASAIFSGIVSVHKLFEHGRTTHVGLAMAAAAAGIVGNQLVARYKLTVGKRIQSATLLADAKHSWLDALSSAGALAGLIAVGFGLHWADAAAGLLITAFIAHVGWEVSTELIAHLMDSVEPDLLAAATKAAESIAGVEHAHSRARWMGRSLIIEIEGFLEPRTTLAQGEALGPSIRQAVGAAIPESRAVLWIARPLPTTESDVDAVQHL